MNYDQTVEYLYSLLPSFQDQGAKALNYKLDKTLVLLKIVGDPHKRFKSIHVGGTNGKGTTSHILAAVLSENHYKVGLYTSPHLKSFTERIKVQQQEINKEDVVDFVVKYKDQLEALKPSFFEMTVVMAFYYFAKEDVDIAVVEVGLGGRFDATNVIEPLCSVITNISLDHQEFLGDSISAIAFEKAGIIKESVPVVIGEYHEDSYPVFEKVCVDKKAGMFKAYEHDIPAELLLNKEANYITLNKKTAYQAVKVIEDELNLLPETYKKAFLNYDNIWGLKGRWQKLNDAPLTYCDTGHNLAGVALLKERLNQISTKCHIVWGVSEDKDVDDILKLLPQSADYYFCQANNGRGMKVDNLFQIANEVGLKGDTFLDVNTALSEARKKANQDEFILVGGSTFVVAELDEL